MSRRGVQVSFDVLSCTASILNLCMISVDRYYAITKPLEYGVKRTPRRMLVCVSLVWLGAACISLPPVLILGNEHSTVDGVPQCNVCQNFGYQIYATLGSFYIPLTVMITVYYKIFRAARKIVLEERRAQSHLENSHCYLEISVKNGVGPVESKIATAAPPERGGRGHRASSSASTVTTVSVHGPDGSGGRSGGHVVIRPDGVVITTLIRAGDRRTRSLSPEKILKLISAQRRNI